MKQFKSKKIRKKRKYKIMTFVFLFIFSYVFVLNFLKQQQLKKDILIDDINYVNFNLKNEYSKKVYKIINSPVNFLSYEVKNITKIKLKNEKTNKTKKTSKSEDDKVNQTKNENVEPIIYIYNTHQSEEYNDYNVYDAANLLSNLLNKGEYKSYFETKSVKLFLDTNNLKYYNSYRGSRKYIQEALNEHSSIKYLFDIHRDSYTSSVFYNNKSYAKVLFVIGSDNNSNEENYNNAVKLNEIINGMIPGITRGVVKHGGKGYNGVYNQDISPYVFLIEIGGIKNTKEEVVNTIHVIHDAIKEYIRGVV